MLTKWSAFEAEVHADLIGVTSCPLEKKGLWTKLHGAEQSLRREDDASETGIGDQDYLVEQVGQHRRQPCSNTAAPSWSRCSL
jgi:hypothetical protein